MDAVGTSALLCELDAMHLEACQEVSDELKGKIVALEARCAALYQGLQVYAA